MKGEELTPLMKIIGDFFENPKERRPDVKVLARVLRGKGPLDDGFRDCLAELLDPRLPHGLAVNWRLVPDFVGQNDKARQTDKIEAFVGLDIDAAVKRGQSIESAIQQMIDDGKIKKRDRTVWTIWQKITRGREWRKLCADAAHSEAARRAVVARLTKRNG